MTDFPRPGADEYAPFYAGYIAEVPEGDVLDLLLHQTDQTLATLRPLPAARWRHRYAPGKWSVAEVLGHVTDAERVFVYRALRIARGDQTPLAGFDENAFMTVAGFDERAPAGLLTEYVAVREATLALFRGLPSGARASGAARATAPGCRQALAYIVAGHERHHLASPGALPLTAGRGGSFRRAANPNGWRSTCQAIAFEVRLPTATTGPRARDRPQGGGSACSRIDVRD
jgi:hypothetical protein